MRKLRVFSMVCLSLLCGTAMAADHTIGSWSVDLAATKYEPGPVHFKSLHNVFESVENGVKVHTTGVFLDGSLIDAGYTAKYDGKNYPVTGAPFDRISYTKIDDDHFIARTSREGKPYSTIHITVTDHGNTMIFESDGTREDGTHFKHHIVYRRDK